MVYKVEDLPVFSYAEDFSAAVTAILARSTLRKNRNVYEQIVDANESITANLDEGFVQQSDDGFAKHVYYSKGSIAEVMRRLRRAARKGHVSIEDVARLEPMAEELGRMLGGFIKYLKQSGFKDRGRFQISQRRRPLRVARFTIEGFTIQDRGSRIEDRRSRIGDRGSRIPGSVDSLSGMIPRTL